MCVQVFSHLLWLPDSLLCAWHSHVWLLVCKAKGVRLSARAPGRVCRGISSSKLARVSACQPAEAQGVPLLVALRFPSTTPHFIISRLSRHLPPSGGIILAATQGMKAGPQATSGKSSCRTTTVGTSATILAGQLKPAGSSGSGHKGCAYASQTSLRGALRCSLEGQESELVALIAMPAGGADPSLNGQAHSGCSHTKACGARRLYFTPARSPEIWRHAS